MSTTTKSPRFIRSFALTAVAAVALVACGSDSSTDAGTTPGNAETTAPAGSETTAADTTAPETTAPSEPVTADQLTVESGFASGVTGIGVPAVSVAAIVTNTAAGTACDVKLTFTLLDAAGTELDSQGAKVATIAAGAAVPVVPNALDAGGAQAASLTATVDTVGECDPAAATTSLETADSALSADIKYVTGTVANTGDAAVEGATVTCVLRDANKAIVGGAKSLVRDAIEPAGSADFKVRLVWAPASAATAECSAAA